MELLKQNDKFKEMVRESGFSRKQIAAMMNLSLDTVHAYMATETQKKFRAVDPGTVRRLREVLRKAPDPKAYDSFANLQDPNREFRRCVRALNMTNEQVADLLGVSPTMVKEYMSPVTSKIFTPVRPIFTQAVSYVLYWQQEAEERIKKERDQAIKRINDQLLEAVRRTKRRLGEAKERRSSESA